MRPKVNNTIKPFNWACLYCQSKTTITFTNYVPFTSTLAINNAEGSLIIEGEWIVCPNEVCKKTSLNLTLSDASHDGLGRWYAETVIKSWQLLPDSLAKQFPNYIPATILNDYEEACRIVNLSPKASATLSRRCLQGMIRDFWKVPKARLIDEIYAIKDKVDPLVWKSIDAVRKVGNIGAHMEMDINIIIDVDPGEAELLIQLIEQLFEEWYIHRHERELKLNSIVDMASEKTNQKKI